MTDQKNKKGNEVSRRDFLKGFGSSALGTAVFTHGLARPAESISTDEGEVPLLEEKALSLNVNGTTHKITVKANETLLDVLREKLELTGAKRFCGQGECGACTVLLDGLPIYACHFLAFKAEGRTIETVESLSDGQGLHPLQEAFIEKDGYQCGFCTPGFLMTSAAFLKAHPQPGQEDIKKALSGNLCRCGNYFKIYDAIAAAGEKMRRS
jgi:aerobic-type carbon monoxide dehydrogenase small subunit (CoxS/CutS family)